MAKRDFVAVGQQPVVNGFAIDNGAVGRMQIDEHRILAIPRDFGMLAGNTSIREAEVGSSAAADDVRTMAHLEYARGAVLQQQGDRLFLGLGFVHGRVAQLSCRFRVDRGDGAGSGGELLSFCLLYTSDAADE
mgnify:CR=1 FL=1